MYRLFFLCKEFSLHTQKLSHVTWAREVLDILWLTLLDIPSNTLKSRHFIEAKNPINIRYLSPEVYISTSTLLLDLAQKFFSNLLVFHLLSDIYGHQRAAHRTNILFILFFAHSSFCFSEIFEFLDSSRNSGSFWTKKVLVVGDFWPFWWFFKMTFEKLVKNFTICLQSISLKFLPNFFGTFLIQNGA